MPKNTLLKILLCIAAVGLCLPASFPISHAQTILDAPTNSSDFTLSWSTDSYAPPSYEGKALPTRNSHIRVVAVPLKKLIQDPQRLYYRWLLDQDIAGWANGQGKSVFKFQASKWPGDSHEIEAQILDEQGNLLFQQRLTIKIADPELLAMNDSQAYAIQDTLSTGTGQSINILAIPLFFNIQKLTQINWQWNFSGQNLASDNQTDPNLLTLKIPTAKLTASLQKSLSITAVNKEDQTQYSSASFTIEIK